MEKNYYDILQVNKNASPEIIEKAYKTLAKKYHPDLQTEDNKKQSEEILKEINEAYEILSNPEKKQDYDALLAEQEKEHHSVNAQEKTNPSTSQETQTNPNSNYTPQISEEELLYKQQQELLRRQQLQQERQQQELAYQEQLQQARQKAYHDAYIQDLKNRGYRIRYKKSFRDYLKGLISLVITILILILLWQIPFIQNFFVDLYERNEIIHTMIDFVINIFKK